MTEKKVMSIALKVLGFYCIIELVRFLQAFAFVFTHGADAEADWLSANIAWLSSLVPMAILIFLAIILISRSDKFAQKLYPSDEIIDFGDKSPQLGWYELVLSVIGMMVLIRVVPRTLPRLITSFWTMDAVPRRRLFDIWNFYITSGLNLAVGLYLTFGSRGLARFLHKLRTGPSMHEDTREET